MGSTLAFYRDSYINHGMGPTLIHAGFRAVNRVTTVAVWHAVVATPETVNGALAADARRAGGQMVCADAMRPYASDPENLLSQAFLDEAARRGDLCLCFREGDTLQAYGWYAARPIRLAELDERLVLSFSPAYTYVYHGYTVPKYRGNRLHALGMALALDHFSKLGQKGLVSYVEANNFASIKSCSRMGYVRFGRVFIFKAGHDYVCHPTAGCKQYGFSVSQVAS